MPYTTSDKIKTAERLADLRKNMGLSYMQLSEKILDKTGVSISHTSLKDYEETDSIAHQSAFKKNMSIANLVVLSEFYNVSFDYLLGRSECKDSQYHDVHEETGLSEKSIEVLKEAKKGCRHQFFKIELQLANILLESVYYTDLCLKVSDYIQTISNFPDDNSVLELYQKMATASFKDKNNEYIKCEKAVEETFGKGKAAVLYGLDLQELREDLMQKTFSKIVNDAIRYSKKE